MEIDVIGEIPTPLAVRITRMDGHNIQANGEFYDLGTSKPT
jgi:hypothetical protein